MLGDAVHRALEAVGVTEEYVQRLIGAPCGCEERRRKLNALGAWARQVLVGGVSGAKDILRRMLE